MMRILCLFLVSVVATGNVLSTWQDYSKAFGTVVSGAFSHWPTLEEARKFAHWQYVQHPTQFSLRYDCAPYEVGGNIARECRVDQSVNCSIMPVLVDRELDIMCFFDVHDNAVKDPVYFTGFDKFLDFLGPLKIHDSVYMHVDGKGSFMSISDQVLTVTFRQEVFGSSQDESQPDIEGAIMNGLVKLDSKSVTLLKNGFFWTSDSTKYYFAEEQHGGIDFGNEGSFEKDYSRFKNWHSILEPLVEYENHGDDTHDPNDHHTYDFGYAYGKHYEVTGEHYERENRRYGAELCGMDNVIEALKYRPGFIEIELQSIAQGKEDKVKNACFAFLTLVMAKQSSVHHMAINRKPEFLNYRGRSIQQVANPGSAAVNQPYSEAGLLGDGQIIGIADSGVDVYSCYFIDQKKGRVPTSTYDKATFDLSYRKVIQYAYIPGCGDTTDTIGGHGTHVCGIAAGGIANGDITSSPGEYDGMAPNAQIAFQDYGSNGSGLCIPGVLQLYGNGYAAGARVHTNSWGNFFSGSGYYSTSESDGYLYQNPGMTIFFAGGNAGGNGNGIGTITMEASGKNMLAVGSSQTTLGSSNISYIAWYSSKGPTYDGRFKPDIVAPGDALNSAKASGSSAQTCDTLQMTGTSMASPAAAGNALLIRQYFQDGTGRFWSGTCNSAYRSCKPFTATGYLIKAVTIHSGAAMSQFAGGGQYNVQLGPPPDSIQGFGRVMLMNVLPLRNTVKGYDLFVADAVNIAENSNICYTVHVVASGKPLMATISWYDPPNVQGTTSKALINDLDLLITSPTGTNYYPNGRGFPDSNNNNEKVVISSANSGSWQVTVSAKSLPGGGNQLFALVITSAGSVVYS